MVFFPRLVYKYAELSGSKQNQSRRDREEGGGAGLS